MSLHGRSNPRLAMRKLLPMQFSACFRLQAPLYKLM
jgi:hypothetical protein